MCRNPSSPFRKITYIDSDVVAGICKHCDRFMVMTRVHGDLGEFPPEVFDITAHFKPGKVMSYNGNDVPNLHIKNHEYLHIQEGN